MFDWDDVPEELGGPDQTTSNAPPPIEVQELEEEEEEQEEEEDVDKPAGLAGLLCLDEDEERTRRKARAKPKVKTSRAVQSLSTGEDRAALRSLRIGELRRRLAEKGVKVPPSVVEKDELVSLLLGPEVSRPAARAPQPQQQTLPVPAARAPAMPVVTAPPEVAAPPAAVPESAQALRSLRIGELRRRLQEKGVKVPPTVVEKDELVSLLLEQEDSRPAAPAQATPAPALPVASAPPEIAAPPAAVVAEPLQASRESAKTSEPGRKAAPAPRRAPEKRFEQLAAEVGREGAPSLQHTLQSQFQRMKTQRQQAQVRKDLAQKAALAEETWDRPQRDGPGDYLITKKTLATVQAERGGDKVDELLPGQVVQVQEVQECDGRLRARILDPPCWFSIVNNESGTRFAERDQRPKQPKAQARKAPSKFAAFSKAASRREPSPESCEEAPPPPPPPPEPVVPAKPSPLALAAQTGSFKSVMKVLQQAGVNVNAADGSGRTPLFAAAASGSLDVTAAMLLHSADPGRKTHNGLMAVDLAASGPVKSLLELSIGDYEHSAVQSVVRSLDPLLRPQVMHFLQEKFQAKMQAEARNSPPQPPPAAAPQRPPPAQEEPRRPPKALAQTPAAPAPGPALVKAAKAGVVKEVLRLLQGGADPNQTDASGETPLFEAAANGLADVTAALLVYRAEPDKRSETGLTAADLAADGTVRSLLAFFSGAEMGSEQMEFMLDGLGESMKEMIGRMVHSLEASRRGLGDGQVGRGAAAAVVPRSVDTTHLSAAPLAKAARDGDVEEVRQLLEWRADANVADDLGETPLFEAVAGGFHDVCALLLLSAADPHKKSDAGGLAAHLAGDAATRLLLDFFGGTRELSNEDKHLIVHQTLQDSEARDAVAAKFRTVNMQEAYKHTLRKLRA